MKEQTIKIAAITAAVTEYIHEEEKARTSGPDITCSMGISPWKLFGRRELMGTRIQWQSRKTGAAK